MGEQMRKLNKYDLDYTRSLSFFKESLEKTNLLSSEAIQMINRQKGLFFTLLPKEADLENLHQFSRGILPEMPMQIGPVGSLPGVYAHSEIFSLDKEIGEYLARDNQSFCVIDDFNSRYNNEYESDLFERFGKHYEEEIYYLLTPENFSQENILPCLYKSRTFWHSLCILTKEKPDSSDILSKEVMQKICEKSVYVMIGAYDGEGYIFWEKAEESK
jgi:hypothetical protein